MKTLAEDCEEAMKTGDYAVMIAGMAGKITEIVKWINEQERERKE